MCVSLPFPLFHTLFPVKWWQLWACSAIIPPTHTLNKSSQTPSGLPAFSLPASTIEPIVPVRLQSAVRGKECFPHHDRKVRAKPYKLKPFCYCWCWNGVMLSLTSPELHYTHQPQMEHFDDIKESCLSSGCFLLHLIVQLTNWWDIKYNCWYFI